MYDVIIIGGGVSGLGGAVYCARFNMKTLIIAGRLGGLIQDTHVVENYPGVNTWSGYEMYQAFLKHVNDYKDKIDIKEEFAQSINKKDDLFVVKTDKSTYEGKTIIYATGTKRKKLGVPGEKEFASKGVSYCATCLPPEENIIVNNSVKEIRDVNPFTKVLTREGTYEEIAGFTKTDFKGDLVSITPRFFTEAVHLTPNHPVLKIKVHKGIGADYWKDFSFSEPEWVEAGALTKQDSVVYPIVQGVQDKNFILLSDYIDVKTIEDEDKVLPKQTTYTSIKIPNKIKLTKDLCRLFGYYVSEGCVHKHELKFSFNIGEEEYVKDTANLLRKYFGVQPIIKTEKNVTMVIAYSTLLTALFDAFFSHYAPHKKIPHWMIYLPLSKQKELLKGIFYGDACMRDKDFCLVTSSRTLAYQVRDFLLRQGMIVSLQRRKKEKLNRYESRIDGRKIWFRHDKYHITIGGPFLGPMSKLLERKHPLLKTRQYITHHAWINTQYAILPIRKIERIPYNGKVLNIGVQKSNTYVAKNFIVHNCDAPLYKGAIVAVVGGSDSAAKEGLLLAEHAKKVYILARSTLHPEPINMDRIQALVKQGKIEVIEGTQVEKINGDKMVTSVTLIKPYKGSKELAVEGVFIEVGHIVENGLAVNLGVKVDEKGEIIIDKYSRTNIHGFYAAGDVTDRSFKQAITGVAEACIAADQAYNYIAEMSTRNNKKVVPK